jgi:hypothetical protein
MFSGTSAATAMISGACAVLLQKYPEASPLEIRHALIRGARVVQPTGCRLIDLARATESFGD